VLITIYANKNVSVIFRDSVALDPVARTVQSFSGFKVESKGVLSATNHLVPDVAFFQGRPFMWAPSLDGVENSGAAQNQHVFSIGQLGSKEAFLFQGGKLSDKKPLHGFAHRQFWLFGRFLIS
jgi:hypothetical protein